MPTGTCGWAGTIPLWHCYYDLITFYYLVLLIPNYWDWCIDSSGVVVTGCCWWYCSRLIIPPPLPIIPVFCTLPLFRLDPHCPHWRTLFDYLHLIYYPVPRLLVIPVLLLVHYCLIYFCSFPTLVGFVVFPLLLTLLFPGRTPVAGPLLTVQLHLIPIVDLDDVVDQWLTRQPIPEWLLLDSWLNYYSTQPGHELLTCNWTFCYCGWYLPQLDRTTEQHLWPGLWYWLPNSVFVGHLVVCCWLTWLDSYLIDVDTAGWCPPPPDIIYSPTCNCGQWMDWLLLLTVLLRARRFVGPFIFKQRTFFTTPTFIDLNYCERHSPSNLLLFYCILLC